MSANEEVSIEDSIQSLINRVTDKQRNISHLNNKYMNRLHTKSSLEAEKESLLNYKNILIQDKNNLKDSNHKIKLRIDELERKIQQEKKNHSSLTITIDSLNQTSEKMKKEIQNLEERHSSKVKEKDERFKSLQKFIEEVKNVAATQLTLKDEFLISFCEDV